MSAKPIHSTRSLLRAFQKARQWPDFAGFIDDLTLLQSKDLDLSVRLGALLAADALLLTTAVHPSRLHRVRHSALMRPPSRLK